MKIRYSVSFRILRDKSDSGDYWDGFVDIQVPWYSGAASIYGDSAPFLYLVDLEVYDIAI